MWLCRADNCTMYRYVMHAMLMYVCHVCMHRRFATEWHENTLQNPPKELGEIRVIRLIRNPWDQVIFYLLLCYKSIHSILVANVPNHHKLTHTYRPTTCVIATYVHTCIHSDFHMTDHAAHTGRPRRPISAAFPAVFHQPLQTVPHELGEMGKTSARAQFQNA